MVTHNPRDSPSLLTFIHPSFVYFIHQYVSDTWQERLTSQPSQQHSGRAEQDGALLTWLHPFKPHLVAHAVAQLLTPLIGHALSHTEGEMEGGAWGRRGEMQGR